MNLTDFKNTLSENAPKKTWPNALQALWWDAKGDWHKAHQLADEQGTSQADDWVHAYLHRKEGDEWNADYWYQRAGKKRPSLSLAAEWEALTTTFITDYQQLT